MKRAGLETIIRVCDACPTDYMIKEKWKIVFFSTQKPKGCRKWRYLKAYPKVKQSVYIHINNIAILDHIDLCNGDFLLRSSKLESILIHLDQKKSFSAWTHDPFEGEWVENCETAWRNLSKLARWLVLAWFPPGQRKQQAFHKCLKRGDGYLKSKGLRAILKTPSSKNESLMSIDLNLEEVIMMIKV